MKRALSTGSDSRDYYMPSTSKAYNMPTTPTTVKGIGKITFINSSSSSIYLYITDIDGNPHDPSTQKLYLYYGASITLEFSKSITFYGSENTGNFIVQFN